MENVAGRTHEINLLTKIGNSGEPELVVVYGRRRVGKTYLIRSIFQKQMAFEISGLHNAMLDQQLENFSTCLSNAKEPAPCATGKLVTGF